MPLQNYQYDTIMREYNRRQAQNRRIQEEHQAEAYEKIPRLREIDEEVATLSARGGDSGRLGGEFYLCGPAGSAHLPGYGICRQPEMLLFQKSRDRTSVYPVKFERNS